MSTYTTYELSTIRNREMLLAALNAMGYGPGVVEVHDQPVILYDWHSKPRPERAHVVIRRQNTDFGASNDIGFVEQAGVWKMILSEYDEQMSNVKIPGGFQTDLTRRYKRLGADKAVRTVLTKTIPRLKALGKIPMNATVTRRVSNGTTRILVSY